MKKKESFKHRKAIEVLRSWLEEWYKVEEEKEFFTDTHLTFVPDITCYENGEIVAFYEVEHTHGMTGIKLGRMQLWLFRNQSRAGIYEVEAEWILTQIEKPDKLRYTDYSIDI